MITLDITSQPPLEGCNGWADFWRYNIGMKVIRADSRNKRLLVAWLWGTIK